MSDELTLAVTAAKAAGALIADRFMSLEQVEAKGSHDVVTAVDRGVEQLILDVLRARFPNANYAAEVWSNTPGV